MATDDGANPSETATSLGKGLDSSFLLKSQLKVKTADL